MSAFLGPIHYWLYHKVQLQQAIVNELFSLGKQYDLNLEEECDDKFGVFLNKPLEEIIDQSNIHGWLQERVAQVEYKYAYSVTRLLNTATNSFLLLKSLLSDKGKELGQTFKNDAINAPFLYKVITDNLLDGMPCDHASLLIDQKENEVIWKRNLCVHSPYWDEVNGDITIYYELRDAWMEGLSNACGFTLHKTDSVTYHINKKMNSIKLMMEEHQYILRMLNVVRTACAGVLKGNEICYEDFDQMIDFIRNYADAHHHGKEEKLLFNEMVEHLGPLGNKLITHGMLVEHDFGRLYIQELREALNRVKGGDEMSKLDVIANAISYTHLLKRHIDKEDAVVYTFAERQLSSDIIDKVNENTVEFEAAAQKQGTQEHYLELLKGLETKYQ